ncbi:MAG: AIR carboxylase family protein [Candidatus Taylorbacteria bacterium]|nr:AIR carboxylase family protein [Candidatus Taylorbacteria bacterium]
MGIAIQPWKPKILIVLGSRSDLEQTRTGIDSLRGIATVEVSILSCHRNPERVGTFVRDMFMGNPPDIVIAGAGMAAALPGMIKAFACYLGYTNTPVIGVGCKGKTGQDDLAATLSIECLPGQPVELGPGRKAYFGPEGFQGACSAAVNHEFIPRGITPKPAEICFESF